MELKPLSYSNTTLVKVKFDRALLLEFSVIPFKYNTC